MADTTNFSSSNRVLQFSRSSSDLINLTGCGICGDPMSQLKALPCLHSYCRDCLSQLLVTHNLTAFSYFNCPQCRHRCQVPLNGVLGFPTNFIIENIKQQLAGVNLTQILHEASSDVDKHKVKVVQALTSHKIALYDEIDRRHLNILGMLSKCVEELKSRVNDRWESELKDVNYVSNGFQERLQDLREKVYAVNTQEEVCEQLKQHAETVKSVAVELEAIKSNCNYNVQKQLQFEPGFTTEESLSHQLGTLRMCMLSQLQISPTVHKMSMLNQTKRTTHLIKSTLTVVILLFFCCVILIFLFLAYFVVYEPNILKLLSLSVMNCSDRLVCNYTTLKNWLVESQVTLILRQYLCNILSEVLQWVTIDLVDITFVTHFLIAVAVILFGLLCFNTFVYHKAVSANAKVTSTSGDDNLVLR